MQNKTKKYCKVTLKMTHPVEYCAWKNMLDRCYRENHPQYDDYGGRGIGVVDRWRDPVNGFLHFISDMGAKPTPKLQLDRINNDKAYGPDNCRWTTAAENMRNRRKARTEPRDFGWGTVNYPFPAKCRSVTWKETPLVPFNDELVPLPAAVAKQGLKMGTVRQRFQRGWPPEKALAPILFSPRGTPRIN